MPAQDAGHPYSHHTIDHFPDALVDTCRIVYDFDYIAHSSFSHACQLKRPNDLRTSGEDLHTSNGQLQVFEQAFTTHRFSTPKTASDTRVRFAIGFSPFSTTSIGLFRE
jgi:hypothetical protein